MAGESSRFDHVAAELLEETGTVTIIPGRPASAAGTNAAPNPIPSALESEGTSEGTSAVYGKRT